MSDPARSIVSDQALVARVLSGDHEAFATLVRAHHGRLLRLARAFVRDGAAAEEVVQETWKAVFAQLDRFEGRASLRAWIFTILANQAKTRGKRDRRSVALSSLGDGLASEDDGDAGDRLLEVAQFNARGAWATPPRPWSADTPEAIVMRREAVEALERAIDALPENLRTVVTLRDLAGLGADEVCNALGISEINQRVLLHRARARLRRALAEHVEGD
ncbi:MAG: sigma-70 family RNA polymerase sigma factor [bacterium]